MANDPILEISSHLPLSDQGQQSPSAALLMSAQVQRASNEDMAASLESRFASLANRHDFSIGELVTWKPGLKHMQFPRLGRPAIVVEILETPVVNSYVPPDSPYFGEILDIRVGVIGDDGAFHLYHVPSNRFQPFAQT